MTREKQQIKDNRQVIYKVSRDCIKSRRDKIGMTRRVMMHISKTCTLLTLGVHAPEGECVCVCLSVTTLVAGSFNST